jgi:hypothetical protein
LANTPTDKAAVADDAFLREVDDAVRRSDIENFWRRYGWWVAGITVLALAVYGGWIFYHNQNQKAAGEIAESYILTLDKAQAAGGAAAAKAMADFDAKGNAAYGAASRMMQANILAEQGKAQEAAALFTQLAKDDAQPEAIRNLALVKQVALQFDTLAPQAVIDTLRPLATPGNPWFPSAAEMTALAYMKLGKKQVAGSLFADIAKEPGAPDTLVSRARQMAGVLGVDAIRIEDTDGSAGAAGKKSATAAKGEDE